MLLFEKDERGPDEELKLQFEAVSRLDPEEKKIIRSVIGGGPTEIRKEMASVTFSVVTFSVRGDVSPLLSARQRRLRCSIEHPTSCAQSSWTSLVETCPWPSRQLYL